MSYNQLFLIGIISTTIMIGFLIGYYYITPNLVNLIL